MLLNYGTRQMASFVIAGSCWITILLSKMLGYFLIHNNFFLITGPCKENELVFLMLYSILIVQFAFTVLEKSWYKQDKIKLEPLIILNEMVTSWTMQVVKKNI